MKKKNGAAAATLLGAIAEAEAKITANEGEDLNALKTLLKHFLDKDTRVDHVRPYNNTPQHSCEGA